MKKINHLEKKQIVEHQQKFRECYQELKQIEEKIQDVQKRLKDELMELNNSYLSSKEKLDNARFLSDEFVENLKIKYEVSSADELNNLLLAN